MRLVLYGLSAYRFWIRAVERPCAGALSDERVLEDAAPPARAIAYLRDELPEVAPPLHLLCARDSRRPEPGVVVHRSCRRYPRGSFLKVRSGIYAPCPELTAAQIAGSYRGPLLARAVSLLMGASALAPGERYDRLPRPVLATRRSMAAYLAKEPGLPGAAAVSELLPYLVEGTASPAEADLALALCLPSRLGGWRLERPLANHRVALSPTARRIAGQDAVKVDLFWPERGLVVEYDSDLTHLTPEQHARDASRRAGLEHDGRKVMTVTREHLYGPRSVDPVAAEVSARAGTRLRPRARGWRERQRALRRLPRGYDLPDAPLR